MKQKLITMIKMLRCKHYIKNSLIILPAFFSGGIFNEDIILKAFEGFFFFCMLSSVIYIINDIKDVERDRMHPDKCNRPIASGAISCQGGVIAAVTLLVFCVLLAYYFLNFKAIVISIIYICINLFYSNGGKNIPVMDVVLLASGYPIRVLFGGCICSIKISEWLFLTTLCISLYLTLGKRRGEFVRDDIDREFTRPVLKGYTLQYLDESMNLFCGMGLVFYTLWTLSKSYKFLITVPVVFIIIMKYNLIIKSGSDGDPVESIFASHSLILLCVVYFCFLTGVLYWK